MPHYPKYTTTVIGAYSVPRWYEPLDRLVTMGQLLPEDMRDALYDCGHQSSCGMSIIAAEGPATAAMKIARTKKIISAKCRGC